MPLKLSIISPSYNQARFIGQTLRSISLQDYAGIEHIVQDAGSTDGTLELLRTYASGEKRAQVFVERDHGQADAINRGFARASGDILTWLNTDDYYADDHVLSDVMGIFDAHPDVDVVYGRGRFVSPDGRALRDAFINANPAELGRRFVSSVGILQPATFFRGRLIRELGPIDTSLTCAFDYELWVRFVAGGARFHFFDRVLANATFHEDAKSSALRARQLIESAEVTKRYFGFASGNWIEHGINHDFAGRNGIVDQGTSPKPAAPVRELMEQASKAVFRRLNAANSSRLALIASPDLADYRRSRNLVTTAGLASFERVIATTFDNAYVQQGLTLIRSVRRYEDVSTPIFIYDLNLSFANIQRISQFENVHVIKYPQDAVESYPNFLNPKNYGYKCTAIRDASRFVANGGKVLWLDAGVAVIAPLDAIFDVIDSEDVFFVNHDDKPNWPFYNGTFCHPVAARALEATTEELLAEHLCSCLVGYRKAGRYQALIDDADRYARIKSAIVWNKHPSPEGAPGDPAGSRPPLTVAARRFAQNVRAITPGQTEEVSRALGYLGHRQDQSVFSILAARYKAPIQSARIYCRSDDASSRASKLNWESGSVSKAVKATHVIPARIAGAITYHHRGTYAETFPLRTQRKGSGTLVILGNGPSLKDFDFARLGNFDAIGMNAAYRFWDKLGWYPRYYICLDKIVGLSHKGHIERLIRERASNGIECFVLRRNLIDELSGDVASLDCVFDFDSLREALDFFSPMPVTTGSHAALFGALLGYERMVLMGIDCNYVEKVAGAEEKGGTVLELAETPVSNPNYFFEGYQVAGDRYNVPNPEPDLHLNSWRAVAPILASRGIKVWNGSAISLVDAFPKRDFSEIERDETITQQARPGFFSRVGVFKRDKHANLDETQVVSALAAMPGPSGKVMVDVGAHVGTSMMPFLNRGWKIHAFEPDDSNRQKLLARLAQHPGASRVALDSRAVSNETRTGLPFYASEVSTGISGLSAFHESHRKTQEVDSVTLRDALTGEAPASVDFLKIDTEGHDLFVLQGFPWERFKPAVIECEFEDAKTVPLGYSFHDLAKFLVDKQYTVYISEWHPVVRYGVRHDWKRLMRYPCELSDARAWGNLLAFRDPVDEDALVAAVKETLKFGVTPPVPARNPSSARPSSRKARRPPESAKRSLPAGRTQPPKLEKRSDTLVILGNGPSLRNFDFGRLRGFDAIGMSAAYRYWDLIGWYPRYYMCLDVVVGMHHRNQIARLIRDRALNGMECFLLRGEVIDALPADCARLPCVLDFDSLHGASALFPRAPFTTGSIAPLFGALLGYERMALMGIDCNFTQKVDGIESRGDTVLELVRTPASNPDYFYDRYQLAGDRFSVAEPTPDLHLESWRQIAPLLAARGIKVRNAGRTSRLKLFPKVDFSQIEKEEATLRSARLVVRMDRLPAGNNWRKPESREGWGVFCRTAPGAKATLDLPVKRARGNLAVVAYHPSLPREQLSTLQVEIDGVIVPHSVHDDVEPRCIVAQVPARPDSPGGRTELALALPAGASDGLAVSSVSIIPEEPRLTARFPAPPVPAWRRLLGQPPHDGSGTEFPLSHFDGRAYLKANPDVHEAVIAGRVTSALEHYRTLGRNEGRIFILASAQEPNEGGLADLFDGLAYMEAHPEAGEAVRSGSAPSALDYFLAEGRARGHQLPLCHDGKASRVTAPELARLDAVREARSEIRELKLQLRGTIETRTSTLGYQLKQGLEHRARPADVARVEKLVNDQARRLRRESAAMAAGRDARADEFRARIDGWTAGLQEADKALELALAKSQKDLENLRKEMASSASAHDKREKKLLAQIEARKAEIDALKVEIKSAKARAELAEAKAASAQQGIAAGNAEAAKVREELKTVKNQAAATSARISHANLDAFNVLGYQGHARALTKAGAERLAGHWAPLLGLSVTEKELYYLAHRICGLENICMGRLATAVDAMLLRILVGRAIKSPRPEILEIGTLFGLGVGAMHETLTPFFERVHFTVIDPLDGYYGAQNRDILTGVPVSRAVYDENLRRAGVAASAVTVIELPSTDPAALRQARKKRYDMLVIDGDHTYEGVKNDAEKFLGAARPGAYVLFDDYDSKHWPDIKRYVDAGIMPRGDLKFLGAEWHTAVFQVTSTRG